MKFRKLIFATTFSVTLAFSAFSSAQNTTTQYPSFEGNGLYDVSNPNNLGAGIFHQSKRSEIIKLINVVPETNWIALDKLITNLLLTTTELSTMENDVPAANGNDLLTVRLNKLLDLGHYKNAYTLYSTIKDTPTDAETSKSGVLTMLYNGQRGKACLEVKISLPNNPESKFWREMNAYCTLSHSAQENDDLWTIIDSADSQVISNILKNKDYKIPYSKDIISSYSPSELSIAIAQNAIEISGIPYDQYNQIATEHLQLLLLNPDLSDENRVILSGYAAQRNIITTAELESLFNDIATKHENEKLSGVLEILPLYNDAKDAILGSTRAKKIDQAYSLANSYGDGLLIPFIPHIAKLDADDLTLDQIKRAIKIFIATNTDIPENWLEDLLEVATKENTNKQELSNVIFAVKTLSESVDNDIIKGSQNVINAYLLSNAYASGINYIIENIDSAENNSDKVFNIYENGFDLTAKKGYTMPPPVVINELTRSSKNQNIAQTVLLAGIIADNKSGNDVYLEVLEHTVNALIKIGFKKQAQQILAQAILDID